MSNDSQSSVSGVSPAQAGSSAGQTANVARSTSVSSGAAKVFREFKWGLLTLFLLMVVVIGLVYDGGRKKKLSEAEKNTKSENTPEIGLDTGLEPGAPPITPVAGLPATATVNSDNSTQGVAQIPDRGRSRGAPIIDMGAPTPPQLPVTPASGREAALPTRGNDAKGTDTVQPPHLAPLGNDQTPAAERTYTVKAGDTLTRIANAMLPGKGNVKAILEENKDVVPDPNRLKVGVTLKIPATFVVSALSSDGNTGHASKKLESEPIAGVEKAQTGGKNAINTNQANAKAPKESGPAPQHEYTVQNGDTLERIARKVYNDGRKWRDLYEWNRDQLSDPGHLRAGQTLKLKQNGSSNTVIAPACTKASEARADAGESKTVEPLNTQDIQFMSSDSAGFP